MDLFLLFTWQPAFWSVGVMLRIPRGVMGDHVDEGWLEEDCVVGALPLLPAANAARTPLDDTRAAAGLAWSALRQPLPNILICVDKLWVCENVVIRVERRFKRNIGKSYYFFPKLIFLSKQACRLDIYLGIRLGKY